MKQILNFINGEFVPARSQRVFDKLSPLTNLPLYQVAEAGRPEVDSRRIGVFGLSMGSTKAWWLSALDPRVRLETKE